MEETLKAVFGTIGIFCLGCCVVYFFIRILQVAYATLFSSIGTKKTQKRVLDYKKYINSDITIPVSVIVPLTNSSYDAVKFIKRVLGINYPNYELILVNDGADAKLHDRILHDFALEKIDTAIKKSIKNGKRMKGTYYNEKHPRVLYIDKEPGGVADAMNCGINASRYPLYICMSPGMHFEPDILLKLVMEFLKESSTVISCAGMRLYGERFTDRDSFSDTSAGSSALGRGLQLVENITLSSINQFGSYKHDAFLSPTGLFALFNKQIVIECGGYRTDIDAYNYDIILRMKNELNRRKRKYKIVLHAGDVCYIEKTPTVGHLFENWRRWQSELMNSLFSKTRGKLCFEYIYNLLFEVFFPIVNFFAYITIPLAAIFGGISLKVFVAFVGVAFALNLLLSLIKLLIEQFANPGYMTMRRALTFICCAVLVSFPFAQLKVLHRFGGILQFIAKRTHLR
jgi:cellulose synthase/poly-beta-1,6-N-acetylglucosamine synthase-like glycosyltransferase